MTNVSDKNSREDQNTHFTFNNFFSFENLDFYQAMWKNAVDPDRPR